MNRVLAIGVAVVLMGGGLTACDWSDGSSGDQCSMSMHILPMRGGSGSSGYSGGGGSRSYGGSSSNRGGGGSRVTYGGRSYTSRYPTTYQRRSQGGVTYVYVGNAWVVDGGC